MSFNTGKGSQHTFDTTRMSDKKDKKQGEETSPAEPVENGKKKKTSSKQDEPVTTDETVLMTDEENAQETKKEKKLPKVKKADRPKRGPARTYRKLGQAILDSWINKLQKRIDRAKGQVHIE